MAFHCMIIIMGTLCLQAMADAADTLAKGLVQGPFVILPQDIRTGPESSFSQFVTDVNGVLCPGELASSSYRYRGCVC